VTDKAKRRRASTTCWKRLAGIKLPQAAIRKTLRRSARPRRASRASRFRPQIVIMDEPPRASISRVRPTVLGVLDGLAKRLRPDVYRLEPTDLPW